MLSLPSAGLIASSPALGWEGIFYVQGGLAIVWCLMWAFLVYDTPEKHPLVSEDEKNYILENQSRSKSAKVMMMNGMMMMMANSGPLEWVKVWLRWPPFFTRGDLLPLPTN